MRARNVIAGKCACETCRTGSGGCREFPDGKIPVGTVTERPDVYRLVQLGIAEPADEECEKAAGMTPLQMQRAQYAQKRTSAGIAPEDFEAYDNGEMTGYDRDGRSVPGPNATRSEGGIILDEYDDE